jgi:hypothetical protein
LIHADNPLSKTQGVFLNPLVRVGYNSTSYDTINSESSALSLYDVYKGIWHNRVLRWSTTSMFKEWVVSNRIRKWRRKHLMYDERAGFCLVNEMQVMFEKGWRHV